ncbi:hypothetical protein ACYCIU_29190, partial [Klebsiella pneumoniae]
MFNSLSDYLQQQRDREEALKRKLSQLKPTVRNGEAGEIIAALIDLGSVGGDFKKTTYDYIYEYFASARCIDVLVVMLFLNMVKTDKRMPSQLPLDPKLPANFDDT